MKKIALILVIGLLTISAFAADVTSTGMSQKDLVKLLTNITNAQLNVIIGNPTITTTSAEAGKVSNNAFDYRIGGVLYTKAAAATSISATAQTAGTTMNYLITVSANGGLQATKGTSTKYPTIPANQVPVFGLKVGVLASGAFTLGSSNIQNSTSYNVTITNLAVLTSGASKVSFTDL